MKMDRRWQNRFSANINFWSLTESWLTSVKLRVAPERKLKQRPWWNILTRTTYRFFSFKLRCWGSKVLLTSWYSCCWFVRDVIPAKAGIQNNCKSIMKLDAGSSPAWRQNFGLSRNQGKNLVTTHGFTEIWTVLASDVNQGKVPERLWLIAAAHLRHTMSLWAPSEIDDPGNTMKIQPNSTNIPDCCRDKVPPDKDFPLQK